jgi:4a-hydroxytetrahydrobiopterin dehydratase
MNETVSPERFHEVDWRVVRNDACAHFRAGSLAAGLALVDEIGRLAGAENRLLTVDRRPDGVTVRLPTTSTEHFIWFSERDVDLAQRISAAAREMGLAADPAALPKVQVMTDALVIQDVRPFWRAVLGYGGVDDEDLLDPLFQGPPFSFQQMDAPRPQRNRIHIDVFVPHDQAEARVAAALAAGGHVVNDENAPGYWTLADAEGNEVDVAGWPDCDAP